VRKAEGSSGMWQFLWISHGGSLMYWLKLDIEKLLKIVRSRRNRINNYVLSKAKAWTYKLRTSFPVIPLGVLRGKAMKKNSKKEKEGELWPLMLQPSSCYKIQSSHIIMYYLVFQTWHWVFQEKQKLEKERLWLLMHRLSSSPASYVQVSYLILSTNVPHYNTECFILLFLILFLKGSSSRQPDSGKSGI